MMSSESEPVYGQSTGWQSERPRLQLFPLIVGAASAHGILRTWRDRLQADATREAQVHADV